jgi:hypothetical protein
MDSVSDLAQNMPQIGMDYITNMTLFGNTGYQVEPSQSGEVSNTFGTVPYVSLTSLLYMQQIQSATSQANTVSTQMTGQQNVTGALTVSDSSGNVVAQISSGSLPATGAATTSQPTG